MENNEHLGGKYHRMAYSFEKDTQKKIFAYFLLITGILVFALTLLGVTAGISEWTDAFLKRNLGITNKWSATYGPEWFVSLMKEFSSLGGKVLLFVSMVLISIYYKLKGKEKLLWKFLFVFLGGNFILLILKLIFIHDVPYEPIDLIIKDITHYPSGHAMISLIFYVTLAVIISRRQRRQRVRNFIMISAFVIVFIVCLARLLAHAHTVTEVLAGLSAGLIWLCLCWLGERFLRIHYKWDF